MDQPTVYIETSVVSYYAARPSRDVVIAGRQEVTRECWPQLLRDYRCHVSALVLNEASQGDSTAARERIAALSEMPVLEIEENAEAVARALIRGNAVPEEYPADALHIALATTNGMDFLLTWNFAHINNAHQRNRIQRVLKDAGYRSPVLCSPDELLGGTE